jgi:hypothetical protein
MSVAVPLAVILGGVTLPSETGFIETTTPNEAENESLDGTLYTDFINNKRSWEVDFMPISLTIYNTLHALYMSQYETEAYLTLQCDAIGLSTIVKASIGTASYQCNGNSVEGFSFILKEEFAVS